MTDLDSGKGHRDENFPVASLLMKPANRAPIMAFYRFARAADDIADHPGATSQDKLDRLAAMIARSAFAQLHYSLPLAMLAVAGLGLIFLAPVILALSSHGIVADVACATLLIMLALYQPILRFYRLSPLWALGLPLVMLFYVACITLSVVQHFGGRGGTWKGRTQALSSR